MSDYDACLPLCATLPRSVAVGYSRNFWNSGYPARDLPETRRGRMEQEKTAQTYVLTRAMPESSLSDELTHFYFSLTVARVS